MTHCCLLSTDLWGFSTILARGYNHEVYILPNLNDRERTATIGKYTPLHRTIKSNAVVVDTTCIQAEPADPRAGAYD